MAAARIAQHTSVKYKVEYLSVVRREDSALAIAKLNDAAQELPYGGLIFFEFSNGGWRAIYSMYMDGSESCEKTISISEDILSRARAM